MITVWGKMAANGGHSSADLVNAGRTEQPHRQSAATRHANDR